MAIRMLTIESVVYSAISEGRTNEEILEIVKVLFPKCKTALHSIRTYRSNLKREQQLS
jgi:hypothetical protein